MINYTELKVWPARMWQIFHSLNLMCKFCLYWRESICSTLITLTVARKVGTTMCTSRDGPEYCGKLSTTSWIHLPLLPVNFITNFRSVFATSYFSWSVLCSWPLTTSNKYVIASPRNLPSPTLSHSSDSSVRYAFRKSLRRHTLIWTLLTQNSETWWYTVSGFTQSVFWGHCSEAQSSSH